MAKNVQFQKVISGQLEVLNPRTTAANVILASGDSLETAIGVINSRLSTIENYLSIGTLYMTDSNGETLTDGEGNNLVAIH